MRDLLRLYGHDYTEEMVFGLGVGVGFVYYHHPGMKPPVYVGGRIFNLEEHLCRHLGVGIQFVSGLDDERAWLEVKEMLDSGTPVMVHVDVYYLDYLRAKRHFSGHRVVLVGYDDEEGVAFVADNDRDEVQECTLANLAKARAAAYLPQPADNAFYRFDVPARLTPLDEAIKPALQKAVRYNIHLTPERERFSRNGYSAVRGVAGLRELSSAMAGWPDSMDDETLSLLCKSLYVGVEKGGTGYGGFFRRIYGRFLREASGVMGSPGLDDLGDEFVSIGDMWTETALTFKDHSGDGREAVRLALPLVREAGEREEAAYRRLERIVGSLEAVT